MVLQPRLGLHALLDGPQKLGRLLPAEQPLLGIFLKTDDVLDVLGNGLDFQAFFRLHILGGRIGVGERDAAVVQLVHQPDEQVVLKIQVQAQIRALFLQPRQTERCRLHPVEQTDQRGEAFGSRGHGIRNERTVAAAPGLVQTGNTVPERGRECG